ncbi:De-etiolated protein 1 Det1-domain-containing protein [Fennellomyces sp. T-0311]|nr:De-etiolated protein 1 Det1-domain-containing protein [Fennellomyces sp. T-0311]
MDYRRLSKRRSEVSRGLHNERKDREQGLRRSRRSISVRHIYTHLTPNHTLYNVAIPFECQHIRRFTSDGQYLITFTPCHKGIQLYSFMNAVYTPAAESETSAHRDFNHFFKLKYLSMLPVPTGHELSVDFCLITKDQKYMILSSMGLWDGVSCPAAPVVLDITVPLSDFAFYTVDIETGELVDKHLFHGDYIQIADHTGVSLYEDKFSVLSIQTQTIHLFRINESGKLHLYQSIGAYLRNDDESIVVMQETEEENYRDLQELLADISDTSSDTSNDILDRYVPMLSADQVLENPFTAGDQLIQDQLETTFDGVNGNQMYTISDIESFPVQSEEDHDQLDQQANGVPNYNREKPLSYNGFTQAMLSFLYKLFSQSTMELSMQYFHSNYDWFASLKMWRIQLIGSDRLLIKLTQTLPEFAILRSHEPDLIPPEDERTMFVIFDLAELHIVDVYENCSNKVRDLLFKTADALRNVTPPTPYESTPGLSDLEREYFKTKIAYWSQADTGRCYQTAMQKLSLYLPRRPNSQPQCPYFDLSLFRYPENMMAVQNWTSTTLDTMNFYCRSTDRLRFKLDARESPSPSIQLPLTLTMIIPNPQYPFIITRRGFDQIDEAQSINFHVRL